MTSLQLIYAPNEIFSKKATIVENIDDDICKIIDEMFEILRIEKGIGLGANMVGILKRIVVVNMIQGEKQHKYAMVNPEITYKSTEMQTIEEASLCYPGISANITRPQKITVKFLDYQGKEQIIDAEGFLATVIQHEMDYLDGRVYLDYLSKMKRDILLKKMLKYLKNNPPHIHTASCKH